MVKPNRSKAGRSQDDVQPGAAFTGDRAEGPGVPVGGSALADLRFHAEGQQDRFSQTSAGTSYAVQVRGHGDGGAQPLLRLGAVGLRADPAAEAVGEVGRGQRRGDVGVQTVEGSAT